MFKSSLLRKFLRDERPSFTRNVCSSVILLTFPQGWTHTYHARSNLWVPNETFFTLERLCKMHVTQMPVQVSSSILFRTKSLVQVWILTRALRLELELICDGHIFSDYWITQYDTWTELHSTENTDKWTFGAIQLQSWTPFSFTKVPFQVCFLAEIFTVQ